MLWFVLGGVFSESVFLGVKSHAWNIKAKESVACM